MSVLVILILVSLGIASLFLVGFMWAVISGQFEDTCTPSFRFLTEDESVNLKEAISPRTTVPNAHPKAKDGNGSTKSA